MNLPVAQALPQLRHALAEGASVILQAPPGAGKTTVVPIALLDEPWLKGRKIVMLEPRRLAARSAAYRMADNLGEPVGRTVGYATRLDRKLSRDTRIEVVTEGIFTRQILGDPGLEQVGLVIFDEFHERSLHADLGLALALEVQANFREDLRILVMSATLDPAKIATLFARPVVVSCEVRRFEVTTGHLPKASPQERIEEHMTRAIAQALTADQGSLLCFLPGVGEIRRVAERLQTRGVLPPEATLCPLYGDLDKDAQDEAIRPAASGSRKIVLATAIAESSITIDGVSVVIDSGLARKSVFDPRTGMSHLATMRASRAAAEQRRGRAGRTGPGQCLRLWSERETSMMPEYDVPEILESDLANLALVLAEWGGPQALAQLKWLDPPPSAKFATAVGLLQELGAVDGHGKITEHGRKILAAGTHPRLANMILRSSALGLGSLACDIAALLEERDLLRFRQGSRDSDLRLRLEVLRTGESGSERIDGAALRQVRIVADEFRRRMGIASRHGDSGQAGMVLGFAYPDRIARRRGGAEPVYLLACGRAAKFAGPEPISGEEFLTVAELDDRDQDAKILLAAPLGRDDLDRHFAAGISKVEVVEWNDREAAVEARGRRMLGEIILEEYPLRNPGRDQVAAALIVGIRKRGLASLPWNDEAENFRGRVRLVARLDRKDHWPEVSDAALRDSLEEWLLPRLGGIRRADDLGKVNLAAALKDRLDGRQRKLLDQLAPTHLKVPSGSLLRLDYRSGETPALSAKVQELFGAKEHPCVGGGRVPVLVQILSPAQRPVQATADLPGFWASSYQLVRKDLRGRYPKHYWPEDPTQATPTRGLKPRR